MSENKTLHILRVEPGKAPEEKDIGSDLKSLQEEVGGLIECVYLDDDSGTILVCNEEGKLGGMEMNTWTGSWMSWKKAEPHGHAWNAIWVTVSRRTTTATANPTMILTTGKRRSVPD